MAKNFTELSLLPSAQGIAVVARRGDLTVGASRAGLILGAPHGLAVSDNLPLVAGTTPTVSGEAAGVMIPYGQWFVTTNPQQSEIDSADYVVRGGYDTVVTPEIGEELLGEGYGTLTPIYG